MSNLTPVIKESFSQYSGAVLQSRALVDSRDCMKPSARQVFYCMETDKFTSDKPYKKTLKAIGSASRLYIHGDSSCLGIIMRAGQSFAMRYPLVEVEGSVGTCVESGNWAAPRYTASKLSHITENLFLDIDKNTIEDWRDNYDDTEKYPGVLPSKGYYNICNGTFGIGIGMSSSIPQFNVKDVNNAMIALLKNPNIDDNQLICMPDFASGGLLLNPEEVRESLLKGNGASCRLRAVIEYDVKDNCLIVSEIPFGVYTNTICGELEAILESEDNPGIDKFNDLTGEKPLIKIYLVKNANPNKILSFLYKNTSLQYWYAINMVMLDNGKFPRVYSWKEALAAHIDHEKIVYRKGFEFDLKKAKDRLHIVDGIIIALANIEEVVETIKSSSSTSDAAKALQKRFILDSLQTDAILNMKLSRLAHLEVEKFEREARILKAEIERIEKILNNTELFNQQLINGWNETSKKFGDERRTKIVKESEYKEVAEERVISKIHLILNNGNIAAIAPTDKIQFGKKDSLFNKATVKCGYITTNQGYSYIYNTDGQILKYDNLKLDIGDQETMAINNAIGGINALDKEYLIVITTNGIIKKTKTSEYKLSKSLSKICKLKDGDSVCYVGVGNDTDSVLVVDENSKMYRIPINTISETGKLTIGSKWIDSSVISATIGSEQQLVFVLSGGKGKFTKMDEYVICGKKSLGHPGTDNTTYIAAVTDIFYTNDNGNKITRCNTKSFTTKSKTAKGTQILKSGYLNLIY